MTRRFQDRVLTSLGGDPLARQRLVHGMISPGRGEAGGYWLQLVISTMLATLGVALSSTAVVIGAMLIAPLMKPLVEVAMGLASGSAALALRAAIRTIASIAVVVLVAMAITWGLPFHEITAELAARTAPSLLDLAIAGACALAAAYATFRSDADVATTAAGTSIGISLVPPLCACGYGLAIGDVNVAGGAALLFTANLSGILAVATVVFVVAGFARVDIAAEETSEDVDTKRASMRIGRAWTSLATRRLGPFARMVPPLVLLAIVFVPLKRAVGEITHRSEIRATVAEILRGERPRVVQYTLDHTASDVILRVVVVGDATTSADLETSLRRRLELLDVEEPRISVWAVPDAASVSALSRRLDDIPPPASPEPVDVTVHRYSGNTAALVRAVWPPAAGELVRISLDLDHPEQLRVVHLGPPLGPTGLQLLAAALQPAVKGLSVTEDALSSVEADPGQGPAWLESVLALVARTRAVGGLRVCLTLVPAPTPTKLAPADRDAPTRALVRDLIRDSSDLGAADGERWTATPSASPCAAPSGPRQ